MNTDLVSSDRPVASLSIDLDNAWAYLRAAGRDDWAAADSYFDIAIPRVVEMLGELALPLTVFLVGRDLESSADVDQIGRFGELSDWEPANHSRNHLPWLHTLSAAEIDDEISWTGDMIQRHCAVAPVGFRGPGFSCPAEVMRVLVRRGYRYDASMFPTSIAPIARAAFLMRSKLRGADRQRAKRLYGGLASVLQPNVPHRRQVSVGTPTADSIWEIPVTTMPVLRTPIHFSYFTFLASFQPRIAEAYFKAALWLCRISGTIPTLLLHPPDFLGGEDVPSMAYFPAMRMSANKKLAITRWGLQHLGEHFHVKTMIQTVPT